MVIMRSITKLLLHLSTPTVVEKYPQSLISNPKYRVSSQDSKDCNLTHPNPNELWNLMLGLSVLEKNGRVFFNTQC